MEGGRRDATDRVLIQGGYLSSAYALRFPQNVKKLILISPVGVPLSPYAPAPHKGTKKTSRDEGEDIAAALENQMLPSGSVAAEAVDLPPAPSASIPLIIHRSPL